MNNKEEAEILAFYANQWNTVSPRCPKKQNETVKEKVIITNANKILSERKQSLPVIQTSNMKQNNTIFNYRSNQFNNARQSIFSYNRSCSTNNLHALNKDQKINTGVYIDFACTSSYDDSKLIKKSEEEIHTYENFLLPPTNSNTNEIYTDNTYLELTNPTLPDENKLQSKSKNDLEIAIRNIKCLPIQPEENSDPFQEENNLDNKKRKLLEQEIVRQSLSKSDLSDTKLSNDSGISSELLTNQRNSYILISSNSNDQLHKNLSNMNSTDSTNPSEQTSDKDFLLNRIEKISNSQESTKNIKYVQTEEEKLALFKEISKQITENCYTIKEIVQFHFQDGSFSRRVIEESQTASAICDILRTHLKSNTNTQLQLFEYIEKESLERPIEDHENIYNIYKSWENAFAQNKFIFKTSPNMFRIFLKSNNFLNEMESNFQIQDNIWVKEPHSKWKKAFASISESTIYFNTKPDSKDHMDKYSLVNLQKYDFYTCTDKAVLKKIFKAPTNEIIVFKQKKSVQKSQDYPCICVFTMQQKEIWIESLKIAKFTFNQLKMNYLEFEKKSEKYTTRIQSYYPKKSCPVAVNFNPSSV